MTADPREMTTGEAAAFRAGWEAAREAAAQFHERTGEAAAPGTGSKARHEYYAALIRAMEPPR